MSYYGLQSAIKVLRIYQLLELSMGQLHSKLPSLRAFLEGTTGMQWKERALFSDNADHYKPQEHLQLSWLAQYHIPQKNKKGKETEEEYENKQYAEKFPSCGGNDQIQWLGSWARQWDNLKERRSVLMFFSAGWRFLHKKIFGKREHFFKEKFCNPSPLQNWTCFFLIQIIVHYHIFR